MGVAGLVWEWLVWPTRVGVPGLVWEWLVWCGSGWSGVGVASLVWEWLVWCGSGWSDVGVAGLVWEWLVWPTRVGVGIVTFCVNGGNTFGHMIQVCNGRICFDLQNACRYMYMYMLSYIFTYIM